MPLTSCNASTPLPSGARVSSPWGWRNRPSGRDLHTGVDLAADEGTPVYAVLPGRVVGAWRSGELSGYGQVIVLQHAPQLYTLYAHLSRRLVSPGDKVQAGQAIGEVGRTAGTRDDPGRVFDRSGAHLHFEFLERWPPSGRDEDRLQPGPILAQLGIIVPPSGPLQLSAEAPACQPQLPPAAPPPSEPSRRGGGIMAVLSALSLLSSLGSR